MPVHASAGVHRAVWLCALASPCMHPSRPSPTARTLGPSPPPPRPPPIPHPCESPQADPTPHPTPPMSQTQHAHTAACPCRQAPTFHPYSMPMPASCNVRPADMCACVCARAGGGADVRQRGQVGGGVQPPDEGRGQYWLCCGKWQRRLGVKHSMICMPRSRVRVCGGSVWCWCCWQRSASLAPTAAHLAGGAPYHTSMSHVP